MDPGLDLPNRRFFELKMERAYRETRSKCTQAYLMLIDVDDFKYINDTYGHEVGDAVLSRISKVLRECLGEQDIPARFGGDELAVIVHNSNDKLVIELAHTIQHNLINISLPSYDGICCTVSIGIASAKNKESISNWLSITDKMLYEVKRAGKNGVCLENGEM